MECAQWRSSMDSVRAAIVECHAPLEISYPMKRKDSVRPVGLARTTQIILKFPRSERRLTLPLKNGSVQSGAGKTITSQRAPNRIEIEV